MQQKIFEAAEVKPQALRVDFFQQPVASNLPSVPIILMPPMRY